MKFISKSVCCLVMENVAFPVPHLRKNLFKIYNQEITRKSEKIENTEANEKHKRKENRQKLVPRTYRFRKMSIFLSPRLTNIIFSRMIP